MPELLPLSWRRVFVVLLVILWLLGMVTTYTVGGRRHIRLVSQEIKRSGDDLLIFYRNVVTPELLNSC